MYCSNKNLTRMYYFCWVMVRHIYIFTKVAEKFIWWYHIYCWWLFWPMGTATPIEEVCRMQWGLCWKIKLIWSYSMRAFGSIHKLFSWPSHVMRISVLWNNVYVLWSHFILSQTIQQCEPDQNESLSMQNKNLARKYNSNYKY